jgi:mono/diheme cytochrome c family protein
VNAHLRPAALAAALATLAGCPALDPMQQQPKYEAYEASEFFGDGLAMRAPPAGTVPFRSIVEPALATGRGPDGKPLAVAPVAPTAALLERGRQKYDVHCAVCHGLLGDGDSQVALNMSLRRPPSLHLYRDRPDGYLYQVIQEGFGLMPSYAHELSVEDRWAVVAYVRALQLSQNAPVDRLPGEARERLEQQTKEKTP